MHCPTRARMVDRRLVGTLSVVAVLLGACNGSPRLGGPADAARRADGQVDRQAESGPDLGAPASQAGATRAPADASPDGALGEADPATPATSLVVDSGARALLLYVRRRAVREYDVGLGRGGVGKRRQGDGKTPLGTYRLFRARPSRYGRFLPVSYPSAEDAARGLADGLITKAEHDRIVAAHRTGRLPPQDTALGGDIGIHGYPRGLVPPELQVLHGLVDITEGCIVMRDADVLDLETRYEPGVVLEIR